MEDAPYKEEKKKHEKIIFPDKNTIQNKKIYFDADGTEIKIGYDNETGAGFVEIISG
ncbi:MAG: hypothetical protein WCJ45_01575 [bacterium]